MDSITDAHARLLRDESIQFHLPTHIAAIRPPPPPFAEPVAAWGGAWLFWAVLAVVLIGIFATLLWSPGGWVRRARRRGAEPAAPPAPAALPLPPTALPEADALARLGQFGEAAHILLLRGVAAIAERFPRALSPSFTSRDIAALAVLPDATRRAFAGIAQPVEQAVFARRTLSREEWEACRALYAGLASAGASPPR